MSARPYINTLAPELIPLILAGDKQALAEGKKRTNPKVVAAVKSVQPNARTKKAPKAPATRSTTPKSTNFRTEYALAKVARMGLTRGEPGWRKAFFDAYKSENAHRYEATKLGQLVNA